MKKSSFTEEQVANALRQAEAGTHVGDVYRQLGIAEATFYVWKKKYGQLGVTERRTPEEENAWLKRLVADLTLDRHILQEVLRKEVGSRPATASWPDGFGSALRSVCSWRVGSRRCEVVAACIRRHGIAGFIDGTREIVPSMVRRGTTSSRSGSTAVCRLWRLLRCRRLLA